MLPKHTDFQGFSGLRVHLGVSGSVSAYRAVEVMRRLQHAGIEVSVTLSQAACQFLQPLQFRALTDAPVYDALFASDQAKFAHLEPAQNAAAFLVAPATANILAKHAHGIGDDLLSTQLLAFTGPVIHAPAMNPRIWESPATQDNLRLLQNRDVALIWPETGQMACGEQGMGRLASVEEIFLRTLKAVMPQDLTGAKMLVNYGPTHELWDPVRILTNQSSGVMGASIALAAWLRGADVTVVSGPCPGLWMPRYITPIQVQSAAEMFEACMDNFPRQDIICLSAAISDYRPASSASSKAKKCDLGPTFSLQLQQNPDILQAIGQNKRPSQYLIGFAAETDTIFQEAQRKLTDKHLDLIVANNIATSSVFGSSHNEVHLLDNTGRRETWPRLPKTEVAMRIIEWVLDATSSHS